MNSWTWKGGKPLWEGLGPVGRFSKYTPLVVSKEDILTKWASVDFKEAGIKFPKATTSKAGDDKRKYCQFYKWHSHMTEDYIDLKDIIEILI